jgi:hypothetical protein
MPFQQKYFTEEERLEARKASRRRYVDNNREKIRASTRNWYERNKERLKPQKLATAKAYYENNREYCIRRGQERRKRKREEQQLLQQGLPLPPPLVDRRKHRSPVPQDENKNLEGHQVQSPTPKASSFNACQGSFLVSFN